MPSLLFELGLITIHTFTWRRAWPLESHIYCSQTRFLIICEGGLRYDCYRISITLSTPIFELLISFLTVIPWITMKHAAEKYINRFACNMKATLANIKEVFEDLPNNRVGKHAPVSRSVLRSCQKLKTFTLRKSLSIIYNVTDLFGWDIASFLFYVTWWIKVEHTVNARGFTIIFCS